LADLGITGVKVRYDGGGDSGSIEWMGFTKEQCESPEDVNDNIEDWENDAELHKVVENDDYNTIQEEGVSLPQRSIIDFQGTGVTATDNGVKTIVTIPTPTPQQAYNTAQEEGVALPQRTTFNFTGAGVTAFDFAGVTVVNVPGGGVATYPTIQDEGTSLPIQPIIDFQGAGVVATNGVGKTVITIPGVGVAPIYGSFYDTTTQTTTSGGIVPMKLNNTDLTCTNGFSIVNDLLGNPTQITATNSGIYNLQFSTQIKKTSGGGASQIYIWFRVNGVDIPNSNTVLTLANNGDLLVAAWNIFIPLTAGSNVQIMWSPTVSNLQLLNNTTIPGLPAIPSVIATINKIN
jgi:hypothetical protein